MHNDPTGFAKMVPGFDFLQSLVKNAGSAMPGIGQWVAPTLDPAELEKRIEELRTVQADKAALEDTWLQLSDALD